MRKLSCLVVLIFCMLVNLFSQETDNTYWYKEKDIDGCLITYYMCKTDAQFNNTFKSLVKKQLGIQYSIDEPNWSSIQNGWISGEGIKKNFPKYYKTLRNGNGNNLNWDNYKYCWCIRNIGDMYFVVLAKRVNGTVYMSFNSMYGYYQWAYTLEVLNAFESSL